MKIFKKKESGPFEANRILDTPEAKIDQIFTKDEENPVALLIHVTENEAKKIGAEGYTGPTTFGAKGEYGRDKKWVTRAIYWPINIPGAQFTTNISGQIISAVKSGSGTIVPKNVQFEEVQQETTIQISGSGYLRTNYRGQAELKGIFIVSGSDKKLKNAVQQDSYQKF